MYTVIITKTNEKIKVPSICFDRGGNRPFITNNRQDANTYSQELEEHFPGCVYKVMEICDV
jgi:hypothetical protein